MTDRPVVVSSDVLAAGDEAPERSVADGRRRAAALLLAAGFGFAAAQAVPDAAPDGPDSASLALVVGRQPPLEATADEPPMTGFEVTLVNTGPDAVRLDRATVDGTALEWDVDRPLDPGRQAAALLRDGEPCEGPLDELSGARPAREVRVRVRDEATRDRLPDVVLPLPPTTGRLYDDHVRQVCALPRLPEAVELVTLASELDGTELVVPLGLQGRSVRDVQVVEVEGTVPGLVTRLTTADAQPLTLPVTVPGRARREIAEGFVYDDAAGTPYRLRVTASPEACPALRERSGIENVVVRLVDPDEPDVRAERPVPVDLTPLIGPTCAAPG